MMGELSHSTGFDRMRFNTGKKVEHMTRLQKAGVRVLLLALTAMLLLTPAGAALPRATVYVRGVCFKAEPGAILEENTAYVPLRAFMEYISPDASVSWDARRKTAKVQAPGLSLTVEEGAKYLTANGRCLYLNGKSFMFKDRLMIPVRPLAQACGMEVSWDELTREVSVNGDYKPISSGDYFYDEDDLYWLSHIIYAEAGVESLEGQIAVGNVVLNRMARKYWPDTVYEVVFDQRCGIQFTPAATGDIYMDPSASAVAAAKMAMEGTDIAGDSLFFVNETVSSGRWFRENCTYVMTLGDHTFYTNDIA